MDFRTYMAEKQPVTRWRVMNVFLGGAMCGAVLGIIFALGGLVF